MDAAIDSADPTRRFQARLQGLLEQMRRQLSTGWDLDSLARLTEETARLQNLASRMAPPAIYDALAPANAALRARQAERRLPDPATSADIIGRIEATLRHLEEAASEPATDGEIGAEPGSASHGEASATAAGAAPAFRILIVEDDRAQAMFAESVLAGAGMLPLVAADGAAAMQALESFAPELILMDLHMGESSGIELTARIREHDTFLHTPVVFLTGDSDPELQYRVLASGADDFLTKPIRPRHLIAAVQSRVQRARAVGAQRSRSSGHGQNGLQLRNELLGAIDAALPGLQDGAALLLEVEAASDLRDRFGHAGFEPLMAQAAQRLAELAMPHAGARLNDSSFLVFAPQLDVGQLEVFARRLRDGLSRHAFEVAGAPLRLRTVVGYTPLAPGFPDSGAVLRSLEQAVRGARDAPIGLAEWRPPEREQARHDRDRIEQLRAALAESRLELLYQPIVAVAGGSDAQFQVLLRLRDSEGRLHSAAEIVPAAEAAGMVHELDRWVVERALESLGRRGADQAPLRLFVSQSPLTLIREDHVTWLENALAVHGAAAASLVIDIRQADALVHSGMLVPVCRRLADTGVRWCMSQYQHATRSDALLQQFPLHYLRLSPPYAAAHDDHAVRSELTELVERAHAQDRQVIGQRVEDPRAAAAFWGSGVDFLQGNLVQQAGGEMEFDFNTGAL